MATIEIVFCSLVYLLVRECVRFFPGRSITSNEFIRFPLLSKNLIFFFISHFSFLFLIRIKLLLWFCSVGRILFTISCYKKILTVFGLIFWVKLYRIEMSYFHKSLFAIFLSYLVFTMVFLSSIVFGHNLKQSICMRQHSLSLFFVCFHYTICFS